MKKNRRNYIASLMLLLPPAGFCQGTFIYDQQSANESTGGGGAVTIQSNEPIGQSFTPTLSGLDFIRLNVLDRTFNGIGATLYVNLRSDSISGAILGSSATVTLPDAFDGFPNFVFDHVTLTPGATYVFQPVVQSGDSWAIIGYNYNYPGGTAFSQGVATPGSDLWFREGVIVPEPSVVSILFLGVGFLVYRRTQQKFTS